MALLKGMSDEVREQRYELGEEGLTFGRAPDNTIILSSVSVSGHHCRILKEGEQFILEDLGSTNGTRVNARRVLKAPLRNKNIVQVGTVEFMFEDEEYGSQDDQSPVETNVEIDTDAAAAPQSFTNISPFNTRKKESTGIWYGALGVVLLLAIAGLVFFLWTLFSLK